MIVRFKKLSDTAVAPRRGSERAAGYDLTADTASYEYETETWVYGTGLAVEIPAGYVGLLFPRSSVYKTSMSLANCVGVIDADYRGEIKARFYRSVVAGGRPYDVDDRIVQLIIMPVPAVQFDEADELSDTVRGAGGFGSTGA